RFLRGVLRAPARVHVRGFPDAPGDPGRRRRDHGGPDEPGRLAEAPCRLRRALLQDRRHRRRPRAILRDGEAALVYPWITAHRRWLPLPDGNPARGAQAAAVDLLVEHDAVLNARGIRRRLSRTVHILPREVVAAGVGT